MNLNSLTVEDNLRAGAYSRIEIQKVEVYVWDGYFARTSKWFLDKHPEHADRPVIKGINMHAKKGEIIGIAGLMGSGRTELAMSIFGRAYGQKISEIVTDWHKTGFLIEANAAHGIAPSPFLEEQHGKFK